MLLRSSEIKPLFIDLSPTQQCLKHSLPALFVPPSPSTHQPPIANRVRPAMATFPLPWLHHRCCNSLRRALEPAAPSLSSPSPLFSPSLFASPSNTASFDNSHCPFSLSHLLSSLDPSSCLVALAAVFANTHDQPSTLSALSLSIYPLCMTPLLLSLWHFVPILVAKAFCFSAPHTPQRRRHTHRANLAISQLHRSRLFRICALALQFAWPLPSRSHFASPH